MNPYEIWDRLIKKYLWVIGILALVLLNLSTLFQIISLIGKVLTPIVVGFAMAYVVNILMIRLESWYFPGNTAQWVRKTRRPLALLVAYLLIFLLLIFILYLIIPQLYSALVQILDLIPILVASARDWLTQNSQLMPQIQTLLENADVRIAQFAQNGLDFANNFTSNLIGTTLTTVGVALSIVVNALLSFMLSLYILLSKEKLQRQCSRMMRAYLPDRVRESVTYVLGILDESFRNFISGEVIEAFILGTLVTVGMWLFRFPYAPMIGALAGFMTLLPLVGAYISGVFGFLLIFVQSPVQGLLFMVFIIVLQQIEGNLIYPKVVGNSIGLPGLWVLASITVGGGLFGVLGMVIAVPVASALYRLIKNDVNRIEARKSVK